MDKLLLFYWVTCYFTIHLLSNGPASFSWKAYTCHEYR